MDVSYAIFDGQGFENFESYGEAKLEAEHTEEIWLVLDDNPVIALPACFNRLIIWSDTMVMRTAVLDRREIEEAWGDTMPGPLGPHAPLLVIDKTACTAAWRSANGQVRTLYGHVAN